VALAPAGFGQFGGALLIGNFGDGSINAFDPPTANSLGPVRDARGRLIVIDGLWALQFGNGFNGGDAGTLYFTAGPNEERDGLFESLAPR
jgi:uncharacterized protein (TIGR03118 family)